jgi:DNA polymerase III sliding clamp (beta) subunit (PCNA family)
MRGTDTKIALISRIKFLFESDIRDLFASRAFFHIMSRLVRSIATEQSAELFT